MKTVKKSPPTVNLQQLRSSYPKGTVLFHEQDERDCAYIIEKGEIEISVVSKIVPPRMKTGISHVAV